MKACAWCGRQNEEAAVACYECGTPLPSTTVDERRVKEPERRFFSEISESESQEAPEPPVPALAALDMGFERIEGFSRPDWTHIRAFIKQRIDAKELGAAWHFVACKWLQQLSKDLGGEARLYHSTHFLCVSDLGPGTTRTLLTYAESVLVVIRNSLQTAAWTGYHGCHVLLFFADQDDYYTYISFYHPDGLYPLSGGVFLGRGYAHVALPFVTPRSAEHTIIHELVHNLLAHLPLPLWLNEGVAVIIERAIERRPFLLDREVVERHARHWTETSIQTFWAGTSFSIPGESNELSYRLAEILVTLLSEKGPAFIDFIKHADWRDAGQDAALNVMAADLRDLAGGFLGPGKWRPQRKAIAELLAVRRASKGEREDVGSHSSKVPDDKNHHLVR